MEKYNNKKLKYIKKLNQQGNLTTALKEVQQYIEKYPKDYAGYFQYANVLDKLGNIDKSIDIYKFIVTHADDTKASKYNAMCRLGEIYLSKKKDYATARHYFERCINEDLAQHSYAYIGISRIEFHNHNYEQAIQILNQFNSPKKNDIYLEKTRIYIELEQYDNAQREIEKITDKGMSLEFNRMVNLLIAEIAKGKGDYYKAKDYLAKAKAGLKNLNYQRIVYHEAKLEEYFQNYEEAINLCNELQNCNSKYADLSIILKGNICVSKKEYQEAEKLYKSVSADNKDKINFCLGIMEFGRKRYKEAEKYFKNSDIGASKYSLALTYYKTKQYNKAFAIAKNIKKSDLDIQDNLNLNRLKILLDQKLGTKSVIPKTYTEKQLAHYSKKEALMHIDREHNKKEVASFNKDINLEALFDEVPELLKNAKLLKNELFLQYEIPYENVGYVDGKRVDTFLVVVTSEEQNIITMYPYNSREKKQDAKVKRKSAIDKFYERYGKKY